MFRKYFVVRTKDSKSSYARLPTKITPLKHVKQLKQKEGKL